MTRLFYYVLLSCSTHFQGVLVMKKLLLVFLLLLQSVILPQNNFIQQITIGDFDEWWMEALGTKLPEGETNADFNCDGRVTPSDFDLWWNGMLGL